MLVGVFVTSFRFSHWGAEEETGRATCPYNYVVNDVQSEISFPCKPVSLSYHAFLLIIQLCSSDDLFIKHLKLSL